MFDINTDVEKITYQFLSITFSLGKEKKRLVRENIEEKLSKNYKKNKKKILKFKSKKMS